MKKERKKDAACCRKLIKIYIRRGIVIILTPSAQCGGETSWGCETSWGAKWGRNDLGLGWKRLGVGVETTRGETSLWRNDGVFPLRLLPFRLLPFFLLPFRLLPFRLLSNFTSFPFRLQLIFVPAFDVVMVKHAMICIIV